MQESTRWITCAFTLMSTTRALSSTMPRRHSTSSRSSCTIGSIWPRRKSCVEAILAVADATDAFGSAGSELETRRQLLEESSDVTPLQLSPDDHLPFRVDAIDLKNRLCDVETNCRDRLHV